MNRKNITLPVELVTGRNLSIAAKVICGVLKSFQKGKSYRESILSFSSCSPVPGKLIRLFRDKTVEFFLTSVHNYSSNSPAANFIHPLSSS